MYQNKHGRFTAPDPLLASANAANPQTFNRYTYTGNNPVNYTDPSGLTFCKNNSSGMIAWNGAVGAACADGSTSVDGQTITLGNRSSGEDSYGNKITPGSTVYFDPSGQTRVVQTSPQNQAQTQGQSVAAATGDIAGQTAAGAAVSNATSQEGITPLPTAAAGPPLLPLCTPEIPCTSSSATLQSLDTSQNAPLKSVEAIAQIAELGTLIPGLNVPFAIIAGTIRFGQGDLTGAGTNLAMAIPFASGLKRIGTAVHVTEEVANDAHAVYQGVDRATGAVKYVGITAREPGIRFAEHAASGTEKALLKFRVIDRAKGLTKIQARFWEQTLINKHGLGKNGGTLLNEINSIAPKYW